VYLDNAATMQKPKAVIDAVSTYYSTQNSNIHRGAYDIALQSEKLYEQSKDRVASWIGATSRQEIIYAHNATHAFNLLVWSLFDSRILRSGDRVLLSVSEHHSNIVPWQMLAKAHGIMIDFVDIDKEGCIDLVDLRQKISEKTKVVSLTAASNVLGSINDLSGIRKAIDASGFHPLFVVDATQALPHFPVNVAEIGCDFLIFTGHKIMAETGIGVLYGKKDILRSLVSPIGGGGSIQQVTKAGFLTGPVPDRFEVGTPHVAGAVSLMAALDCIESIGGYRTIQQTEQDLMEYLIAQI
jgi:cysteine desulfurase/selenocysteine lyase